MISFQVEGINASKDFEISLFGQLSSYRAVTAIIFDQPNPIWIQPVLHLAIPHLFSPLSGSWTKSPNSRSLSANWSWRRTTRRTGCATCSTRGSPSRRISVLKLEHHWIHSCSVHQNPGTDVSITKGSFNWSFIDHDLLIPSRRIWTWSGTRWGSTGTGAWRRGPCSPRRTSSADIATPPLSTTSNRNRRLNYSCWVQRLAVVPSARPQGRPAV